MKHKRIPISPIDRAFINQLRAARWEDMDKIMENYLELEPDKERLAAMESVRMVRENNYLSGAKV